MPRRITVCLVLSSWTLVIFNSSNCSLLLSNVVVWMFALPQIHLLKRNQEVGHWRKKGMGAGLPGMGLVLPYNLLKRLQRSLLNYKITVRWPYQEEHFPHKEHSMAARVWGVMCCSNLYKIPNGNFKRTRKHISSPSSHHAGKPLPCHQWNA